MENYSKGTFSVSLCTLKSREARLINSKKYLNIEMK